ncbi:hypothetical protein BV898_03071 [Hypsibius exemplaris]|uniref:Uncharacterized protein n=1 Tax=Hypsibius exemplaris TaxID=2072580 RepID=A0A1W0X6S7_HYPEX|nr:hypothetical protein BV898_03071 [Hypsibius exemplaris]
MYGIAEQYNIPIFGCLAAGASSLSLDAAASDVHFFSAYRILLTSKYRNIVYWIGFDFRQTGHPFRRRQKPVTSNDPLDARMTGPSVYGVLLGPQPAIPGRSPRDVLLPLLDAVEAARRCRTA